MAQYITGTASGPNAVDDLILQLRTFLIANGWTEHDVLSSTVGSRDIVFKGSARDPVVGDAPFIRLTQTATGVLTPRAYRDWDVTAHTGICEAGSTSTAQNAANLSETSFSFLARCNGYALGLVVKTSTPYVRLYVGFLRRGIPSNQNGVTKTTQAYPIGTTTVNVATDMTSKLVVGQRVALMNFAHSNASANKTNMEYLTIQSIATGSITFTTGTTKAYDAGALVGENPYPNGTWNTALTSQGVWYNVYFPDGTYTTNVGTNGSPDTGNVPSEASTDPGDITQRYACGILSFSSVTTGKADLYGFAFHFYLMASGSQVNEDLANDGFNDFVVLSINTATFALMFGPK